MVQPYRGRKISIHALREEGDFLTISSRADFGISIHALREEGDPRSSMVGQAPEMISIHALREEGDASGSASLLRSANFYPRPPRGGRRCWYDN